jgi:hypothetical protein
MPSERQPTQIERELMGGLLSERDRARGERMAAQAPKLSHSRRPQPRPRKLAEKTSSDPVVSE